LLLNQRGRKEELDMPNDTDYDIGGQAIGSLPRPQLLWTRQVSWKKDLHFWRM
jgi:hypothetical protein